MTKKVAACCTSPAAICYWFTVSLLALGTLSIIGIYWRPFHALSAVPCLFAMGMGCLANWLRNRSLHCAITGPLFLIAGAALLASDEGMIRVNTVWVWPSVFIGVGISFLLEGLFATRRES